MDSRYFSLHGRPAARGHAKDLGQADRPAQGSSEDGSDAVRMRCRRPTADGLDYCESATVLSKTGTNCSDISFSSKTFVTTTTGRPHDSMSVRNSFVVR